ncbi:MAG: NAD(P)-dependent oxidoreductase [Acidimicrobiales bacterium]|nr:NAD(P)-dependent oxidoreductase [Acidimicrobiales bacterium]
MVNPRTAPGATVSRAGFIGLGNQGLPMAEMINRAGIALSVWARRPESLDPFRDTPVSLEASLADLGAAADVVGICVVNDRDVLEVVRGGLLAAMRPGGVILIHSTVLPDTCKVVAEEAEARGVEVLDAPVMGGGGAASRRQLAVAVGGNEATYARVRPIIETYGNPVEHVGPLGTGQILKLLYNLFFVVNFELQRRLADLAVELGLGRQPMAMFLEALKRSEFAGNMARDVFPPAAAAHARPILGKDVGHALTMLSQAGLDPGVLESSARDGLDRLDTIKDRQIGAQ